MSSLNSWLIIVSLLYNVLLYQSSARPTYPPSVYMSVKAIRLTVVRKGTCQSKELHQLFMPQKKKRKRQQHVFVEQLAYYCFSAFSRFALEKLFCFKKIGVNKARNVALLSLLGWKKQKGIEDQDKIQLETVKR